MLPVIPRYVPMGPTLVSKPFHRDGWVYEEKVDGYRFLAYRDRSRTRLISRNDVDHTARYPELAAAIDALPASSFVLDGELAIFDLQLRSRFDWLRQRPVDAVATLPVLIAFDLPYIRGRDLTQQPLRERRRRLEALVASSDQVHAVRRLASNGLEAWSQVVERGYEGLVAKDADSLYVSGRSLHWMKVKQRGWTDADDRWRRRLITDGSISTTSQR
jgi:bifunctional non-homologous end joining protein LigD